MLKIIEITSEETLKIRHEVMWPEKPMDYIKLPNDDKGIHFGLFLKDEIISVISLFIVNKEAQFRKFATQTTYQGKGYGTILLKEIFTIAKNKKAQRIWCNARTSKSSYYTKFGMNLTENKFVKGGIKYVIMERKFILD